MIQSKIGIEKFQALRIVKISHKSSLSQILQYFQVSWSNSNARKSKKCKRWKWKQHLQQVLETVDHKLSTVWTDLIKGLFFYQPNSAPILNNEIVDIV